MQQHWPFPELHPIQFFCSNLAMSVGVGSKYYSGFNPLNPGSCVLWMDAAQETAANGAFINTTTDKSTSAYSITAVTNNTVTLTRPGLNGLPIYNLGANRMLISSFVWRTKFTAVLVTKNAVGDFILAQRSGGTYRNYIFGYNIAFLYVNAGDQYNDSVAAQATSVTGTDWTIWIVQYNNVANPQWRLNGTVRSTTRTGGTTQGDTTNTAALYFNGTEGVTQSSCQIAEILIYNDFLSTAQCEDIEGYLATKWGLRSLLPGPPSTTYVTNPASIPNCVAWLDSADSATVIRTGSTVTQWNDKTSNGYNATPSATPSYSTTAFNTSYPGVTMTSGFFTLNIPANTFSNGISAISVFRPDANTTQFWMARPAIGAIPRPIDSYTNATQNRRLIGNGTQYWEITLSAGYSYRTQSNTIYYFEANSGSTFSWVEFYNGVQQSMAGTLFSNGTPSYSDATSTTLRLHLTGIHCEHIIFNGRLTRETRRQLEAYLANKWGLLSIYSWTNAHRYLRAIPVTRPFVPLDTAGCVLWLDGADPLTITLSGSNVTSWTDKSGNGNTASNFAGTITYSSNSLVFSGTEIMNTPLSSVLTNQSMFCVLSYDASTSIQNVLSFRHTGTQTQLPGYSTRLSNRQQNVTMWGGTLIMNGATISTTTPFMYGATISAGGASFLYSNGTQSGTRASGTTSPTGTGTVTIGNYVRPAALGGTVGDEPLRGRIYEIVLYNVILTSTQRQQVEGYLAAKWGLRSTLPSTHLIKNSLAATTSFNPRQISNCVFWIDAADPSTITSNASSVVTQVGDKSGNGRTLTNGMTSTGFTWNITKMNGSYPSFYYNSTQNVTLGSNSTISLTQPATMFIVLQPVGTASFQGVVDGTSSTARWYSFIFFPTTTTPNYRIFAGLTLTETTDMVTATPTVYSQYFNTTSSTIFRNGTSNASGNISNSNCTGITVGSRFTQNTETFQGHIAEVLYYQRLLTTQERQQVEGYLAWKWGLSNNLASNHPYRRISPV